MMASERKEKTMTTHAGQTIDVAYNPQSRRFETVWPEDELGPDARIITLHWSRAAARYVTIPE